MRGIIFEGIPGSGKTSLFRSLLSALSDCHRGPLWAATEHLTERTLEPLRTAGAPQAETLVRSHLDLLEGIQALAASSPGGHAVEPIFLLERFHVSLTMHIPEIPISSQAAWETALSGINASLVLMTIPPQGILERSIMKTCRHRNEAWRRYLLSIAPTEGEQAEHFRLEQEKMMAMAARSLLPTYVLDTGILTTTECLDKTLAILYRKGQAADATGSHPALSAGPARSRGRCPGR